MPLASRYRGDVPLRLRHVLDVHIATDRSPVLAAITSVHAGLVVPTTAKEHGGILVGTEAERTNRVPIEGLELLEGPESAAHRLHVPQLDHVVAIATREHLRPAMPVQGHRRDPSQMCTRFWEYDLVTQWYHFLFGILMVVMITNIPGLNYILVTLLIILRFLLLVLAFRLCCLFEGLWHIWLIEEEVECWSAELLFIFVLVAGLAGLPAARLLLVILFDSFSLRC